MIGQDAQKIEWAKLVLRNSLFKTSMPPVLAQDIPLSTVAASALEAFSAHSLSPNFHLNGEASEAASILLKAGILNENNFAAANLSDLGIRCLRNDSGFYCQITDEGLKAIDYHTINTAAEAAAVILKAHFLNDSQGIVYVPGLPEGNMFSYNKKLADQDEPTHKRIQDAFEMLVRNGGAFDIPATCKTIQDVYTLSTTDSDGVTGFGLNRGEMNRLLSLSQQLVQEVQIQAPELARA